MRRILAAVLCLMLATPAGAADWFVHALGGTTTQCTGHGDNDYDGAGTGEDCAYANPQDALSAVDCTIPDHVYIRAGSYAGAFTLKDPCVAPSDANRFIIEGPGDDTAVFTGTAGSFATLLLANDSSSWAQANRFVTVTGLKLIASDRQGIDVTGTWEGVWIDNNHIEIDDGDAAVAMTGHGAGCIMMADGSGGWWGTRITNNTCLGTGTFTGAGLTGSNAVFIRHDQGNCTSGCTLQRGIWMSGNTATNIMGALFDGNATEGIIENNKQITSNCIGNESACVQDYNSEDMCVRGNLFVDVRPAVANAARVVGGPRTTDELGSHKASLIAYNNTMIGVNNNTAGPTGDKGCFTMQDGVVDRASHKSYIVNNICYRNFGHDEGVIGVEDANDKYAIRILDCGDNGFDIMNNIVYNVGWPVGGGTTPYEGLSIRSMPAGCTTGVISGNFTNVDPSLETTNWTPDNQADPECGAGITTVTCPAQANRPADTSKSWIGYDQGACVVGGGSTGKVITIIISSLLSSGIPPREVWRYTLAENEALGFMEAIPPGGTTP